MDTDHPAQGHTTKCSAASRCGICRILETEETREQTLFRRLLAQDRELVASLRKISELFAA